MNKNILAIVLGYLSDNGCIKGYKISSHSSMAAIEKCFMYVCTVEKDCFYNSARMCTSTDFVIFKHISKNWHYFEKNNLKLIQIVNSDKIFLWTMIEKISAGDYDKYKHIICKVKEKIGCKKRREKQEKNDTSKPDKNIKQINNLNLDSKDREATPQN